MILQEMVGSRRPLYPGDSGVSRHGVPEDGGVQETVVLLVMVVLGGQCCSR